jgi:hypothetical protein
MVLWRSINEASWYADVVNRTSLLLYECIFTENAKIPSSCHTGRKYELLDNASSNEALFVTT